MVNEGAVAWAKHQSDGWTLLKMDARGQRLWTSDHFSAASWSVQTDQLLMHMEEHYRYGGEIRAALILLSQRPVDQWAERALALKDEGPRAEAAALLYRLGYKRSGADPFSYLETSSQLNRPWTEGLGMHLDAGNAWRFQWIPNPVLLPSIKADHNVPKAMQRAAQPGVLIHLKELRPGLERLKSLACGGTDDGLVATLAQGSRAGFLLRHIEPWLKEASPALEPLAHREAWLLHYGQSRDENGPREGTLVFIPGELPSRTKLALSLLQLNPTSKGARSRSAKWKDPYSDRIVEIQQVRGSGGVLNLFGTPDGTWICDRESPLKNLLFGGPSARLGDRAEWCRTALASMRPDTEVSLWLAPQIGAGAAFENIAAHRRMLGTTQQTWANPSIAKAAPRNGSFSLSMGAGPTEWLLKSMLRLDDPWPMPDPETPTIAQGSATLSPQQKRDQQLEVERFRERRVKRDALRGELSKVSEALDLRGAALYWNGWVTPPKLSAEERVAQAQLRKLKREAPYQAARQELNGQAEIYGGFGEPGLAPSIAIAISVKPDKKTALIASLSARFSKLFEGESQKRSVGGVELHRVRTEQAFAPSWAVVNDTLILGSDDSAVMAVAAGLQGQAPTLADFPSAAFARAEVDGATLSKDLESLLLAYLRTKHGTVWWWGEPPPDADEAGAEVASTFGPFLGALKSLGKVDLELDWGPGGLEARRK